MFVKPHQLRSDLKDFKPTKVTIGSVEESLVVLKMSYNDWKTSNRSESEISSINPKQFSQDKIDMLQ